MCIPHFFEESIIYRHQGLDKFHTILHTYTFSSKHVWYIKSQKSEMSKSHLLCKDLIKNSQSLEVICESKINCFNC